jgi:hypothetical protein
MTGPIRNGRIVAAESRVMRTAMLAASRRFQVDEGTALRAALDELVDALDAWALAVENAAEPEHLVTVAKLGLLDGEEKKALEKIRRTRRVN